MQHGRLQTPDFVTNGIDNCCPDCWKDGCGMNGCFGVCADGLEVVNPFCEQFSSAIWCLGSPLAFPIIFCFTSDPHTHESSGYEIGMLEAPCRRPLTCCLTTFCLPCGQWYARRKVLGGDMTKYKLWQGYHDGPQVSLLSNGIDTFIETILFTVCVIPISAVQDAVQGHL